MSNLHLSMPQYTEEEYLNHYSHNWSPDSKDCPTHKDELPCASCYLKKNAENRKRQRWPRFIREELSRRGLIKEEEPYEAETRVEVGDEVSKLREEVKNHVDLELAKGTNPELLYESMEENEGKKEGYLVTRVRSLIRRNKTIRGERLEEHRQNNNGHLPCEGCGKELKRDDRAEVHHENPLMFQTGAYEINKKDLAVYCADCHHFVTQVELGTRDPLTGIGITLKRPQVQEINHLWKDVKNQSMISSHMDNVMARNNNPDTLNWFNNLGSTGVKMSWDNRYSSVGDRKPLTDDDPRHGTIAGFQAHKNHGTEPCDDCKQARRQYLRDRADKLNPDRKRRKSRYDEIVHGIDNTESDRDRCRKQNKGKLCSKCNLMNYSEEVQDNGEVHYVRQTKNQPTRYKLEEDGTKTYFEGQIQESKNRVRKFRSRALIAEARRYWDSISPRKNMCQVCGDTPEDKFGKKTKKRFQMHHLNPLSNYPAEGGWTNVKKLAPVCESCHNEVIHELGSSSSITLEDAREVLKNNRRVKSEKIDQHLTDYDSGKITREELETRLLMARKQANTDCNCHGWPKLQCPNTTEAEKQQITDAKRPSSLESVSDHHKKLHDIADAIFGDF